MVYHALIVASLSLHTTTGASGEALLICPGSRDHLAENMGKP